MQRRNFITTTLAASLAMSQFDAFATTDPTLLNDPDLLPFMTPASKPEDIGVGNGVNFVRTIIRQNQMNNHFSCIEGYVAPRRIGPPIHLHKELDELMYVVEGTAGVMVEDEIFIIEKGGFVMRPHGLVHTFFNPSDKPMRFIDIFPNQNFEDYLEGMFIHNGKKLIEKGLKPDTPEFGKAFGELMDDLNKKFGVVYYHEDKRFQSLIKKYNLT